VAFGISLRGIVTVVPVVVDFEIYAIAEYEVSLTPNGSRIVVTFE